MVKRSLTQQSDNNPKTKYSNGKTLENFPFLIHLAPKRLFRQHALLDLLDLVTEHFVCLHQVRNRLAGMEYRRMVLPPIEAPIIVSGAFVCCLLRYIAIWRACAISRVRRGDLNFSSGNPRYSHTTF